MPDAVDAPWTAAFVDAAGKTVAALGVVTDRRDSRAALLLATVGYVLVYLVTVGDLAFVGGGSGEFVVRTADDLSRAFTSLGFFRYDAVAVVSAAGVTYLFAPLNLLVASALALLVGANLALTYLGLVQPRACGLEASTGVLAGIPALLSGAACCGPTILLVAGVQASATLISGLQLLVPFAFATLIGSLLLIGRQVDPAAL